MVLEFQVALDWQDSPMVLGVDVELFELFASCRWCLEVDQIATDCWTDVFRCCWNDLVCCFSWCCCSFFDVVDNLPCLHFRDVRRMVVIRRPVRYNFIFRVTSWHALGLQVFSASPKLLSLIKFFTIKSKVINNYDLCDGLVDLDILLVCCYGLMTTILRYRRLIPFFDIINVRYY